MAAVRPRRQAIGCTGRVAVIALCFHALSCLSQELPHAGGPPLETRSEAQSLLEKASDAAESDDPGRAAELAQRALDLLGTVRISEFPAKLDIAALAVESLLQAGDFRRASEILALGSDPDAVALAPDHPSKLRLELARARALSFSDRNEAALELRLTLQPSVEAVFGAFSGEVLWNRLRIANLEMELGRPRTARTELEALRASIERSRAPGDRLRILTTKALANALALLDLEGKSLELLGELRKELVVAHGEDDARVIDADEQIARMQMRRDQLESALRGASRVFLWRMQHLGFSSARTLQSAWMLALLYREFGRNDTARSLIEALLAESARGGVVVPRQLALRSMAVLGGIEGAEGNVDSAEEILRSVWQGYAAIVGGSSADTAGALVGYALLLVQNGRVDRICPVLQQTFGPRHSVAPDELQIRALSKMLLGLCVLAGTPPRQAVRQALAKLRDGWNDLRSREGAGSHSAMYALSVYAWASYRHGDRQTAKRLLQELVRLAEQSRHSTPAGSYTHDYWFSRWMTDHGRNLGCRTLALLHAEDGELDEALRVAELARDRRLRDRFFERGWLSTGLSAQVRERLRSLTSEIHALDEQLALESRIVERVGLESRRILAVAARDEFEQSVRRSTGVGFADAGSPTPAQLRGLLDAGTAVASIQASGNRWWAAVITRDSPPRFVPLDREPDLGAAARAWGDSLAGAPVRVWPAAGNRLLVGYQRPEAAVGGYLRGDELAARVGRAIMAPLASAAPRASRFVIVADDELASVPFGAMPLEGAVAAERFEISYAPSLGTYAALGRSALHPDWDRDLLALAVDQSFDVEPLLSEGLGPRSYRDSVRLALEYAATHPLPFAAMEVQAAALSFPASGTTVLRGPEASKSMLQRASEDGSLARYRYVHIAAHAFSFPNDPERSMLVLNGTASTGAGARVLTAAELANLRMGSRVVILAGCGTGIGRYEPGQGLLGFAFAALAAGNQAALLSLWEVADDLTQRFVTGFFERLSRGARPAAALAATQREFARDPDARISNPATWAAFVLYGSP
jgi:CHAT domain-containing protein